MNFVDLLNFEIIEEKDGIVIASLTVSENHLQPFGLMHGGVSLSIAETIASIGSNNIISDDLVSVGTHVEGKHIRPVKIGEKLKAVATVINKGRTTHIWEVKIFNEKDKIIHYSTITTQIINK